MFRLGLNLPGGSLDTRNFLSINFLSDFENRSFYLKGGRSVWGRDCIPPDLVRLMQSYHRNTE